MTAMRIAGQQGGKLLELRAAMSLAALWVKQCKRGEARELLVPVYSSFAEGLGTRQLRDAKELVEALSR